MSAAKYRPEIDGLRAIAILLVVLYHASFSIGDSILLPGGYIGVDVFFVISGYLITRILLFEMQRDSFSFQKFYERRARRILPALLAVTCVSSIFAWQILMPDALLEYGQSLLATALFGANIFFLKIDNYTAELIAHRPLLHMWSLGIEEQFYIIFPPLLLLVFTKFKKYLTLFLSLVFIVSLLFSEYCSSNAPGVNFYLAPSRAWELVGGGILAWLETRNIRFPPTNLSKFLPPLGILLILAFAILADDGLRHPSLYTLPPVLGTMAIILITDSRSLAIKLLTLKPMVWTGLISYSLYLWHQPVFALSRIKLERVLLTQEKMLLIACCFILATFSYFLVEKPTRNRNFTSSRTIWTIGLTGSLMIAVLGFVIHLEDGFPKRYFAAKLLKETRYGRYAPDVGSLKCKNFVPEKGHCQFAGPGKEGYTLFTVGDSHIRTLDAPIVQSLNEFDFVSTFVPLNSGTSFFSFGLDIVMEEGQKKTSLGLMDYNKIRYNKILEFENPLIITGGRLPIYLEHERFDNLEGGREPGEKCYFIKPGNANDSTIKTEEVSLLYQSTLAKLLENGIKVVVIYPIPEVGWDVPKEISKIIEQHPNEKIEEILENYGLTTSYQLFQTRTASAYEVYDSLGDHPNLLRIYPEKLFCKENRCYTNDKKSLYYRDDNHLSFYGAKLVLKHTLEQMQNRWN